jgi:hypothetical protein
MPPSGQRVILRRDVAGLWALAFVTSAIVGIHGLAYWDAGDYVRLAIEGGRSGLLLGRPLFLLVSHLILRAGVDPASAEIVLRWFWTGVGAIAAPAIAVLASRLGLPRRASITAGVALALSPSFAHSAHQVLTDVPSLAIAICALIAAAEGRAITAGVLIGVAILTRETAALHLVALGLLLGRRAPLALGAAAAVVAVTLVVFPPPAFDAWLHAMSRSIETHPITLWQIASPLLWVLAAGPVPVLAGLAILFWRRDLRPPGRWMLVSVPAGIATVLLLFYPDGSFSPRYMLATVPLAFFLPAAAWMAERPRTMAAALVVPLVILAIAIRPARAAAARGSVVIGRMQSLPATALVVPGHYCPQARLGATIYQRADLTMMCPGWEWPLDPQAVLDAALAAGRPIAVDLADDAWMPPREVEYRDAIRAWAARHPGHDVAGFSVIEK